MIQEGAAGEVKLARGSFSFLLDRPNDVRWDPALGGGSLWDVGSYPVSFIRWIAGEPNQVFGWQTLSESDVDQTFAGLLRQNHGVQGAFDCGFQEPFRSEAEVVGTDGTLLVERPYPIAPQRSRLLLRHRGEDEARVIAVAEEDAYQCEVEALAPARRRQLCWTVPPGRWFGQLTTGAVTLAVPVKSSRANAATLEALYESARRGEARSVSPG